MMYNQDDALSYPSVGNHFITQGRSKLSPPVQRREADSMRMARESSNTTKQHGYRQSSRRVQAIDTRSDDSYSLHPYSRDIGTECRGAPKSTQSRGKSRMAGYTTTTSDGIDPSRGSFDPAVATKESGRRTSKGYKKKSKNVEATSVSSISSISTQSQDSNIPRNNMAYWTSLSVRVAMTVIQANGSETVAEKAANAVLNAGMKNHSTSSLGTLATTLSVLVLEAGGDHEVAVAVTKAVLNCEDDTSLKTPPHQGKKSKKYSRSNGTGVIIKHAPSFQSRTSRDVASLTPSMTAKQSKLTEREDEMEEKTRALEEAEQSILQKEKELAEAERLENGRGGIIEVESSMNQGNERLEECRGINDEEKSFTNANSQYSKKFGEVKNDLSFQSRTSQDVSSVISSMTSKRRQLKEKEDKIAHMTWALEEAEQLILQKEKELAEAARLENERKFYEVKSSIDHDNGRLNGHRIDDEDGSLARANSPHSNIKSDSTFHSRISQEVSSVTPSMTAKRRQLKEIEDEISRKNRALEEAALLCQQKEKEIGERMAEAARLNLQHQADVSERMAALNDKMAALDAAEATLRQRADKKRVGFKGPKTGEVSVANAGSGTVQNNDSSGYNKPSQPPHGGNKSAFGELSGRLYSLLDAALVGSFSQPSSFTPNTPRDTTDDNIFGSYNTHANTPRDTTDDNVFGSYSTHASDSTSLVTNLTGGQSRARTATSVLTDDQRNWKSTVSILTDDTGWKYRDNNQAQTEHQLNQALMAAMNQYPQHPPQDTDVPMKSSVTSLKPISESYSRQSSNMQPSINQSPSKHSMTKLKSSFFSFSMKSSGTGKRPAGRGKKYLP